jgi:hypothetical protein
VDGLGHRYRHALPFEQRAGAIEIFRKRRCVCYQPRDEHR